MSNDNNTNAQWSADCVVNTSCATKISQVINRSEAKPCAYDVYQCRRSRKAPAKWSLSVADYTRLPNKSLCSLTSYSCTCLVEESGHGDRIGRCGRDLLSTVQPYFVAFALERHLACLSRRFQEADLYQLTCLCCSCRLPGSKSSFVPTTSTGGSVLGS